MANNKFILFENVKIVVGKSQSLIIDLQRENVFHLPNSIKLFIDNCYGKTIKQILNYYYSELDTAKEYLNFLLKYDLCGFVFDTNLFPKINNYWDSPYEISNSIIDINKKHNISKLSSAINDMVIPFLSLRIYEKHDIEYLFNLILLLEQKIHIGYTIYLPYEQININAIVQLVLSSKKCYSITFYNAPTNQRMESSDFNKDIHTTTEAISSHMDCGKINGFFNPNMKTYTESLFFNTCLNRKVSIDVNGDIKNCPSMVDIFGNIEDTTLAEAIEKPNFKKYWDINKDKIHVCKDCEFRYICTDCRAYVEDPEDILSKPLKCGYNPYTGEWSEWSTNPLKQKAIQYYGMTQLVEARKENIEKD